MGMLTWLFKKPAPILKEEDNNLLREIQRQAYLEEAKKLVQANAVIKAQQDFQLQKEKKQEWQMS